MTVVLAGQAGSVCGSYVMAISMDTRLYCRADGVRYIDAKPLRLVPGVTSKDSRIGYGRVQSHIFDAIEAAGGIEWVKETSFDWDYRLLFGWPRSWQVGRAADDVIYHTMFESEELPEGWANILNRTRLVWVPSVWCKDVFRDNGVTTDIMVSGYGVNRDEFPFEQRYPDDQFTFMTISHDLFDRKGGWQVWRAFCRLKLRGELKNALLLVKFQKGLATNLTKSGNPGWVMSEDGTKEVDGIAYIYRTMPQAEYARLLHNAHCLVYPQRAEGFGLIPLEFMATGGLAMVTNRTGCREYLRDDVAVVMPEEVTDSELEARMVWAYENRDAVCRMGQRAAEYVAQEWTWELAGLKARRLLYEFLGG